ncbi:MAG: hypothetical protein ABI450_10765, partial [Rhizomicrobium sp.]
MTASKQHLSGDDAAQILLGKARALLKSDEERHFFDRLFAGAAGDDIDRSSAESLAAMARMAWHEALLHKAGDIRVTVLKDGNTEDPESVVVAINDDRPFLFDSALAAAIAAGARIRMAFHPLLEIAGKPTSVIVLVTDAIAEGAPQVAVRDSLEASFVQGRDAVRDWKSMLARLKQARDGLAARSPKGADIAEDLAFLDWLGDNHFTFLGARDYALTADGAHGRIDPVAGSGLGALS